MSLDQIAELKGIPTKDNLLKLLKEKQAVVTFTKLNGDQRVMTCTNGNLVLKLFERKGE